jgi:hypothetical protein
MIHLEANLYCQSVKQASFQHEKASASSEDDPSLQLHTDSPAQGSIDIHFQQVARAADLLQRSLVLADLRGLHRCELKVIAEPRP